MFAPLTRRSGVWLAPVERELDQQVSVNLSGIAPAPIGRLYGGPLPTGNEIPQFKPALLSRQGRFNPIWRESIEPLGIPSVAGIIVGVAGSPTGVIRAAYDPNLLSDVVGVSDERWQDATLAVPGIRSRWQVSAFLHHAALDRYEAAQRLDTGLKTRYQPATPLSSAGVDTWQAARFQANAGISRWEESRRVEQSGIDQWQEAGAARTALTNRWRELPRLDIALTARHQEGARQETGYREQWSDGQRLVEANLPHWQDAGYPGNAPQPGPAIPAPIRGPWGNDLHICRPLPGTALKIAAGPCPTMEGYWNVPVRRLYRMINSATLVRLPDLTPLPVISMTIETDSKSWCWALSATLATPEAWPLIEPQAPAHLPREVQATINGHTWQFLLDIPNRTRKFNSNRVSISGRSRSAWLDDPYDPRVVGYNANVRTANQIAEELLELSGWTVDWQLDDWLIPAKRWDRDNTRIGALKRLVNPVRGLIYTDPALSILTVYPEYPVASWLWEAEIPDVTIPEAAIRGWTQKPDFQPSYNGVYVSGTTHGVLAFIKIQGTDGATTPAQPIVEVLCCDENGVAARMRGLAELSAGGPGYTLSADLILTEAGDVNGPGLLRPGNLVQLAGLIGMTRGVSITAQWNEGLTVRQSITVERKEETA